LDALSYDLRPILSEGTVTNIAQLTAQYALRYTNRPPLFSTSPGGRPTTERDLPEREYFWLPSWSVADPPSTPMFWCYFKTPRDMVDYLAINGTEHTCLADEFSRLAAAISNRVERAGLGH
jgi:hypothetical protein